MDPENAIDLSREAIRTCIFVGGPILLVCLLIGLAMSVFQAMTQLHDQTISFVPKILLLIIVIGLCLPWLSDRMSEFAKASFEKPMFAMQSAEIDSAMDQESEHRVGPVDRVAWNLDNDRSRESISTDSPFIQTGNTRRRSEFSRELLTAPQEDELGGDGGDDEFLPPEPKLSSPFVLPHYRYEVTPRDDTEG